MKAIVFDTETTGLLLPSTAPLDKQPFIIELGATSIDGRGRKASFQQLINPGFPLPAEIIKITGITDADLKGAPSFAAALPAFRKFFDKATHLIAHNAPFDVGMLTNDLRRVGVEDFPWPPNIVCTVQEYFPMFGRRPKLIELYQKILGKPLPQTHRALDDVAALVEIIEADEFLVKIGAKKPRTVKAR